MLSTIKMEHWFGIAIIVMGVVHGNINLIAAGCVYINLYVMWAFAKMGKVSDRRLPMPPKRSTKEQKRSSVEDVLKTIEESKKKR